MRRGQVLAGPQPQLVAPVKNAPLVASLRWIIGAKRYACVPIEHIDRGLFKARNKHAGPPMHQVACELPQQRCLAGARVATPDRVAARKQSQHATLWIEWRCVEVLLPLD